MQNVYLVHSDPCMRKIVKYLLKKIRNFDITESEGIDPQKKLMDFDFVIYEHVEDELYLNLFLSIPKSKTISILPAALSDRKIDEFTIITPFSPAIFQEKMTHLLK